MQARCSTLAVRHEGLQRPTGMPNASTTQHLARLLLPPSRALCVRACNACYAGSLRLVARSARLREQLLAIIVAACEHTTGTVMREHVHEGAGMAGGG